MGGSTLKPFALAAGIKAGFSLKDTFDGNSPFELPDGTGEVENQGDESYGSAVNLIKATEDSINTAFVDLTTSIPDGPQKVMEMMNAMGIPPAKAPRKNAYGFPDHTAGLEPFPGIALGSATVSPINMANGYATIANGGRFHAPYIIEKVVNKDGETIYDHSVSDEQAIDQDQGADIAADVTYAMQQVVESGSGIEAPALGRPAAGKTGTATVSNGDVSSSWFTGFTPQLATSVMYVRGKGTGKLDGWLPASSDGRDGYFGGNYPAKTWTAIMTRDMEGVEERGLPGAGVRRRRGARRGPPADPAAEADQEADADRDAEQHRPADQDADRGADADPADPAADDRGADADPAATADGHPDPDADLRRPGLPDADAERHRDGDPRGRRQAANRAALTWAWWNRMRW